MGIRKSLLTAVALWYIVASPLAADIRKQNIDIIVALDKSLSMEHKVDAVKAWVNSYLIDQVVIPGDFLFITAFYGKADIVVSQVIKDDADKAAVKRIVSGIKGNGRFTDIGNALDVLKAEIATKEKDGRDKYVLLLTDGIQEAPPTSKYFSPDGRFNHEFLENTKTIQQKGWKIMILGIGTETAAKDLAEALKGQYTQVTGTLSPGALAQSAGGLFGAVTLQGSVRVEPVSSNGSSAVDFTLKPPSDQQGDRSITVNRIDAQIAGAPSSPILSAPTTITVKKDAPSEARIPVKFPPGLAPGSTKASLSFSFPVGQGFVPSNVEVTFNVKSWAENNALPLGAGVILAIVVIVALILLLRRLTTGGSLAFEVLVDESPVSDGPASLSAGRQLFLNELEGSFSLIGRKNARSIARFFVKDRKLGMGVLKADRFPKLTEVPPDVRGESFVLKAENGRKIDLEIRRPATGRGGAQPGEAASREPPPGPGRPRERRRRAPTRARKRAK